MPRVLLTLPLLLALFVGWAQIPLDSPERRALEQDLQRYQQLLQNRGSELDNIQAALGTTAATLKEKLRERDAVSAQLADKRQERQQLLGQIAALEEERVATEARITDLEASMGQLQLRVQDLLVSLYKQRGRRTAAGLVDSGSFHDLRVRNHYLGLLSQQDADIIRQIDGLLTALDSERQRLAQQLAQLEQAEADLVRAEAELQVSAQRLAEVIEELDATQAGQMVQQQALLEEQTRIERSIGDISSQLEQEIARLREEERKAREAAAQYAQDRDRQLELQRQADQARARADALSTPLAPTETGFVRPFEPATLISRFGDGNNSYLGIRAPAANAAVRAVQTGRVAGITYLGANLGYMLALQHDGGLMTIYVNLRQPLVEQADTVPQGGLLGYLGGGTLTRNDVLQFYAQRYGAAGNTFIDPAPLLGW